MKEQKLEKILDELVAKKSLSQGIIAVEAADHSFQWIGARGETGSGHPIQGDTPFFIASIDKLYNATITFMLMEMGELNIDQPIIAYLPGHLTEGLHSYRGVDSTGKITLRHLLSHTSGLPDWLEDRPRNGKSLVDQILEKGDRRPTIEEIAASVREDLRPHFPPQDLNAARPPAIRYSDTNFILLIAIIETITGMPLHQVHRKFLHEPLGLRQTRFIGESDPTSSTKESMRLLAGGERLDIPLFLQSMRGIEATASDMIAFLRAFMNGEIFRNPDTAALMQGRWLRFGLPTDMASLRSPSWPIQYSLGIKRFQMPRLFTPFSPMPPVIGHTGSTGCWLFYSPDLDIYLAGSVNEVTAGAVPYRLVPAILRIIYP